MQNGWVECVAYLFFFFKISAWKGAFVLKLFFVLLMCVPTRGYVHLFFFWESTSVFVFQTHKKNQMELHVYFVLINSGWR